LIVDGMNFQPGATVAFASSGITVGSVVVSACNRVVVNVTVAPGAATGPVSFKVSNPDGVFGNATLGIQ
jgi:hypothetical protein